MTKQVAQVKETVETYRTGRPSPLTVQESLDEQIARKLF